MTQRPAIHGYTHVPEAMGGTYTDPIPGLAQFPFMLPWARRVAANLALSVPSGGANEVLVTGYDATEGSVTPAWDDYFNAVTDGIQTAVHGIFTVTIEANFSPSFAGRCWFSLSDEIGDATVIGDVLVSADGTAAGSWPCQRWPIGTDINIEIGQDSGSSQTLDDFYLEIVMVGDYDGEERVDSVTWPQ